jgi:hypothetical protein
MSCTTDRTVIRGDSDNFTISFKDSNGDAIDITDWTVWFTVRSSVPNTSETTDDNAVISVKNEVHSDALNGQTLIEISHDDTDVNPKSYFYDIQYKKPDGTVKSSGHYRYIVIPDITRSSV